MQKNLHAHLKFGRLDHHDQALREAAQEPVLEFREVLGVCVACENNLLAVRHHALERQKEVRLRAFAVSETLDIVDEQHVDAAVAGVELAHGFGVALGIDVFQTHGVHEFLRVLLRGHAQHLGLGIVFEEAVADGVHQVRLAQARFAVDEQ